MCASLQRDGFQGYRFITTLKNGLIFNLQKIEYEHIPDCGNESQSSFSPSISCPSDDLSEVASTLYPLDFSLYLPTTRLLCIIRTMNKECKGKLFWVFAEKMLILQ